MGVLKAGRNLLLTTGLAAIIYVGATGGIDEIIPDSDNIYKNRDIKISQEEYNNIINNVENSLGYDVESYKEDDYLLLNAVLENNNLSDSDKYQFLEYGDMFYENPFLNREKAYRNLKDVKIDYNAVRDMDDLSIVGEYDNKENTINIYDDTRDVKGHEIIHCIYNVKKSGLDSYFIEGMTELLYNEYFEDNPFLEINSYPLEVACVKMLGDLCGSDTILEAYSTSSMKPIIDVLSTYSSKGQAKENLELLNNLMSEYRENNEVTHYVDYDNMITYFNNVSDKKLDFDGDAIDYNSYKYNLKLFRTIFSDNVVDSYLNTIEYEGIGEKAYFSEKLKEDFTYFKTIPCDYTFEITYGTKLPNHF